MAVVKVAFQFLVEQGHVSTPLRSGAWRDGVVINYTDDYCSDWFLKGIRCIDELGFG